jgi:hypothetical protein
VTDREWLQAVDSLAAYDMGYPSVFEPPGEDTRSAALEHWDGLDAQGKAAIVIKIAKWMLDPALVAQGYGLEHLLEMLEYVNNGMELPEEDAG